MELRTPFEPTGYYDDFPRVEERFREALDESLNPRGPDLLYEIVAGLGLPAGANVLDVGCGEGAHTLQLAGRFGFTVRGIDPVPRHLELATQELEAAAERDPSLRHRASFALGGAERLPVADDSADLVWCRDVLVHVADLGAAYREFRRALRPGGRALVYQMFATCRLEPLEAQWLFGTMGVVEASADPGHTERAIADAGFHIDQCLELGTEWGEFAEEHNRRPGPHLLRAARLLREPARYIDEFGPAAYDIMFGDCLWHIYRMIGKLNPRAYLLSIG